MKKSLIAMAVSGAFAAPAFAATSNVDVYGVLNISVEDNSASDSDLQVTDRQSLIGFKGSEDLGGGLKAIWQIEQAISASPAGQDGVGGASLANRNTYVGLSGGFGTALIGRHDTPYKMSTGRLDIFADTVADWNIGEGFDLSHSTTLTTNTGATGIEFSVGLVQPGLIDPTHDLRSPNAIAYVSPNFNGFSFAAAVVASNSSPTIANNKVSLNGANSGDSIDAYSLSVSYENGPLFLTAGYQDAEALDSQAWKVGVGYAFGDLKLGAVYENVSKSLLGAGYVSAWTTSGSASAEGLLQADRDTWIVNAAYTMGPLVLKAEYGQANADSLTVDGVAIPGVLDIQVDKWAVGVDYNLSKRTKAYVVYNSAEVDVKYAGSEDVSAWALGVKHSF